MVRDSDPAWTEHVMEAISTISDLWPMRRYQTLIELELLTMGPFVVAEKTPHLWTASVTMPMLML